ncbi:glycosyltransferase family 9 protein [Aquella oligotrophica]|uniref:Glycosyltransferase family 9 protein n=1 Tax=Aquella oligotrophica TaxID=2067065 RepID=A0A2I7N548_9NEIS|nr:glycosyltransferase family 9 protein [Aquella oligotrophica]AUR51587.1 hypothetical protein CUN60_04545 [Aquella oligotrophica]
MKILLIKRGAIGDLLMATPLIRQLKLKCNASIDLLVGENAAIACRDNPHLNRLIILPDTDFSIKGVFRFAIQLIRLRKQYDYVFLLDKHWYFNLMANLLCTKTVGYYREDWQKFTLYYPVLYNDVTRYHCYYYLDLLKQSNLASPDYTDIQIDLPIKDSDQKYINEKLYENNLEDFVVLVNSGGNNAYEKTGIRMLPEDKVIELLELIIQQRKKIILIGGKVDRVNYDDYISQLLDNSNCYNWAGELSLAQSAYLISKARIFYTTDCGAMHFGVAMGLHARLKAFFGPSDPRHILPPDYIGRSSIWHDKENFDPAYQLEGVIDKNKKFFRNIRISDYV